MTDHERKAAARRALTLLDLTNLDANCTHDDIDRLCARADTPHGKVAAICIWPRYVSHAHRQLGAHSDIAIATVVNFPDANQEIDLTRVETRAALDDGADEIDLVLPYRAFRDGDRDTARWMVEAIVEEVKGKGLLKVILETGELGDDDLIRDAARLAIDAGADFIKTSTGKVAENATLHSAELMLGVIAETNRKVGFKPAGGIKTTEDCAAYLAIADRLLGPDWAMPATFRFGASSVLDDLLAALDGRRAETGNGY